MACRRLRRTQLVHEDTRLTQFAYKLQNRIAASICANAGGEVVWNNFLFVDQDDASATPQRGSLTDKYGTIQEAIDAAHEGDVILINPGDYVEDIDLTDIANGVTIQGAGPSETFITGVSEGAPAVMYLPAAENIPLITLVIKDLCIIGPPSADEFPTARPLSIICDSLPTSFALGIFKVENVRLISSVPETTCISLISCVKNAELDKIYADEINSSFMIRSSGSVKIYYSAFRNLSADFDNAGTVVAGGHNSYQLYQSSIGDTLAVNNQCVLTIDSECNLNGIVGNFVTYLDDLDDRTLVDGKIKCEGYVSGDVLITYTNTNEDFNTKIIGDFDHSEVDGAFRWISGVTNISIFDVVARNAIFNATAQNAISADGTALTGQQFCKMDLTNSTFDQKSVDATSGLRRNGTGIDRSIWTLPVITLIQAATTQTFAPPYINPTYQVHYMLDQGDVSAFGVITVGFIVEDSFATECSLADTDAIFTLLQHP